MREYLIETDEQGVPATILGYQIYKALNYLEWYDSLGSMRIRPHATQTRWGMREAWALS